MRIILLCAVAAAAISAPAMARNGQAYIGVEGGAIKAESTSFDLDMEDPQGFSTRYKKPGWEGAAIIGYDFGMMRAEAEVGYKRLKNKSISLYPALADEMGLDNHGPYDPGDFGLSNKTTVLSGMVNTVLDFGNEDGLSFYAGGGVGRARVKMLGDRDDAWAWQLIGGARYAVSDNVDVGLKYRYFNTEYLRFRGAFDAGPQVGPVGVTGEGKLSTHSLLATLTYNFGGRTAAPPPPPPETKVCPDGRVIAAYQNCPAPPPPPPPAPERG